MNDFFRELPKITNNHIHIFALIPYRKLLKTIMKIDPDLYNKIYVYKGCCQLENSNQTSENDSQIFKNSLIFINDNENGIVFNDTTKREDWIKISDLDPSFKNNLVITKHTKNPFFEFEKIQTMFRTFIRNYKVYYYLWYTSLYVNHLNNVFYLNVRGKPGTIHMDVMFGQRLYIDSKKVMSQEIFTIKLTELINGDRDIKPTDFKYMYRQYLRIKCESDLIMKAVNDFNQEQERPFFVDDHHLIDDDVIVQFDENYNKIKSPQMMVQYIITFPKKPKSTIIDIRAYTITIKIILYIAVIINNEYGFNFFNGVDLVGNEQESHDLSEYSQMINRILYFSKFGINFIPHVGETNIVADEIPASEKYILDKNINRIGHGISFSSNPKIVDYIAKSDKIISIEVCPISNYLLGYYLPQNHPHRKSINNQKIKLMICSDDNGLFNYSTVTRDYIFIYKYWGVSIKEIKRFIINGIGVIPQKYKKYYFEVFNYLWEKKGLDKNLLMTWKK